MGAARETQLTDGGEQHIVEEESDEDDEEDELPRRPTARQQVGPAAVEVGEV